MPWSAQLSAYKCMCSAISLTPPVPPTRTQTTHPPPASCVPPGTLLQVMQDWLAERQLDRKALDALSRNVAQLLAWEEYVALQGAWGRIHLARSTGVAVGVAA